MNILLVDDDDLILASVPSLLGILGHHVESVDRGAKALALLEASPEPDLVIMDVTMPDMGGVETLKRLRVLKPNLPVLLATGNVDAAVEEALRGDPHTRVIPKPFTLGQIRTVLAET
ncbi:response regulator [Geothrix sp. 21YS21S-2]|uniref:response regulator n=1 Tax=Geothrix sp. 21YS21S-2 TaxID=3068893 RepID=UPI0027BA89AC|nr:response regulator [Geothrix sp. 21YS21S-2]